MATLNCITASSSLLGQPFPGSSCDQARQKSSSRGRSSGVCVVRSQTNQDAATEASQREPAPAAKEKQGFPPGSCQSCGRVEMVGGCNGEGRIQGGIGAVPGFRWWPIKAYRPCPAFVEAGGKYKRTGQSLDEVAFGRKRKDDDLDISQRLKGG